MVVAISAVAATGSLAQQDMSDVQIETIRVTDGVYKLTGQGGNIGLSIGKDGAFLIDDQYAPLTEKIVNAVTALTDEPIRFLVNTHWHGDHVGNNGVFGRSRVPIVAHRNVRRRMTADETIDGKTEKSAHEALPTLTFEDEFSLHMNGETIRVRHYPAAHTDGDCVVSVSYTHLEPTRPY